MSRDFMESLVSAGVLEEVGALARGKTDEDESNVKLEMSGETRRRQSLMMREKK